MTSWSHHVMETKHENKQTMETKDRCFCEESFIDRSFLILEIFLGGGGTGEGGAGDTLFNPLPLWLHSELVYDKKYFKAKTKSYEGKVISSFHKMPKESSHCISLSVFLKWVKLLSSDVFIRM